MFAARSAGDAARSVDTLALSSGALSEVPRTFDFPLVARIAASLCKMTDVEGAGEKLPMGLIDAHVNAIKVVVRDGIKDPNNPMAKALAMELERQVTEFLKSAPA
jgi:hypothetical protein